MAHPPASAPGDTRQSLVDEGGSVADGLECVSSAPAGHEKVGITRPARRG